jgi:outer membrane protein OmpU
MANFTDTSLKYKSITSVMHVYEGGVEYQFSPALKGVGGYQHTTFEGHAWNEGSAGLLYSLSKATLVYVSGDFLHASAGVDPVIGWGFTPSLSNHQADVRIGMFHTF